MQAVDHELRRRVRERIEKDGDHWIWMGVVDARGVARIKTEPSRRGTSVSVRKLLWEWHVGPVDRLRGTCNERSCVAPHHMREWGSLGNQRHRRRWTCGACGVGIMFASRHRHQDYCRGEPPPPPDPVAELRATQDAVEDYRKGMTPERICEAYAVQPATLAKRIERQAERTAIEAGFARALRALAARRRPTEGPNK